MGLIFIMIYLLDDVLNSVEIQQIKNSLEHGEFNDGKLTAGQYAATVKQNLQWVSTEDKMQGLSDFITMILSRHKDFHSLTYAKKIHPPFISLSQNGGHYGPHVDDALMINHDIVRSDISCTIALNDKETYEGGELVMHIAGKEHRYKLKAGQAIIYPSTTLHEVTPVTSGQRLVAVTWIQSFISSHEYRDLLHDLDEAKQEIFSENGKTTTFDKVSRSHANLLRFLSEN